MTKLEIIDGRLNLFTKYLEYRTEFWNYTPFGRMYWFKKQGVLFYGEDTLSFDEWLNFQRASIYII